MNKTNDAEKLLESINDFCFSQKPVGNCNGCPFDDVETCKIAVVADRLEEVIIKRCDTPPNVHENKQDGDKYFVGDRVFSKFSGKGTVHKVNPKDKYFHYLVKFDNGSSSWLPEYHLFYTK